MYPVISRLVAPCLLAYLKPAAGYAREVALAVGFEPAAADMLHLAVEEAVLNVIEHAFGGDSSATFEIVCEESGVGLTLRVKEKGTPFDPARLNLREGPPDLAADASAAGLGAHLMRNAVDEMAFRNLGREGKELVLTKYLPAASRRAAEAEAAPAPHIAARKGVLYEVRPLRPEDATELARCAYRSYGYNYDEYIYYPERIVALMQTGLLHPVAAVSPEGEIVGHGALKRRTPDDPVPETGAFFVDPALHGTIIFIQIYNYVFELARRLPGVQGVFARNVTHHILAQKAANSFGFKDCGLLAGPAAVDPASTATRPRLRETRVLAFHPLAEPRFREVYPSPSAKPFVERVYKSLEFPFQIRDQASLPPNLFADLPDQVEIEIELLAAENSADIRVRRHGKNTLAEVEAALRRSRSEGVDTILLRLDLEDPATGYFGQQLEDMGFLFCGVLPHSLEGRDALLLQCLNNARIDYASIHLHSTFARDVLDYVRSRDPNAAHEQTEK